ncbi:MAG: hypothetical protein BWX92_03978 [Deltaproteobacteria bacterium ADurb.Bin135]|nr:MAG: hypothetical protein BWX92_03978 [Deltaproteobacteria bacterium ADurb.Bin135]
MKYYITQLWIALISGEIDFTTWLYEMEHLEETDHDAP